MTDITKGHTKIAVLVNRGGFCGGFCDFCNVVGNYFTVDLERPLSFYGLKQEL